MPFQREQTVLGKLCGHSAEEYGAIPAALRRQPACLGLVLDPLPSISTTERRSRVGKHVVESHACAPHDSGAQHRKAAGENIVGFEDRLDGSIGVLAKTTPAAARRIGGRTVHRRLKRLPLGTRYSLAFVCRVQHRHDPFSTRRLGNNRKSQRLPTSARWRARHPRPPEEAAAATDAGFTLVRPWRRAESANPHSSSVSVSWLRANCQFDPRTPEARATHEYPRASSGLSKYHRSRGNGVGAHPDGVPPPHRRDSRPKFRPSCILGQDRSRYAYLIGNCCSTNVAQ